MTFNATPFITSRSNKFAITENRIKNIFWYVVECYNILLNDRVIYSKSWCEANTRYHFEDYLKMEFVDNYLIKNKSIIQNRISVLEEINFSYEIVKRFTDSEGIEGSDKIDIYINKLGLQNLWKDDDEHIYLAIECKRINQLSDCSKYISDIQKFCDRNYKHIRIPFEGMLAFIEDKSISHERISNEVNERLINNDYITTTSYLTKENVNSTFDGGYRSVHGKKFENKATFSIFHLLFDYSSHISN